MLIYKEHEQKSSDKFAVWLIKRASRIGQVKNHGKVDFKTLYTSILSENYKFSKDIVSDNIYLDNTRVETIAYKGSKDKFALIHLHGGAYVLDYNDTYRQMSKMYLKTIPNMKVFSLFYSLAPKHPYPKALEESVSLYKYILNQGYLPQNIIIAGDSAGGGLALATTLYLRDNDIDLPRALIVMSPWTNLAMNGKSHEDNKYKDPLFGVGSKPLNVLAYARRNSLENPYISPVYGDFNVFTDMLMFVGGDELIKSDTLDVAEKAKETNEVLVHNFLGMFHVFPIGFNKMDSSKTAWQIIKNYINEKLRG